ncbi:sulfotransferase 6B1-like [Hemicordylus capensis]|uniref:sulfotransferase 6B1-like n=1 Tax=Hemicordylus capensis TaxID=884348 RepID=UPI0023030D92|nr:sulfotransferase 6B1-like [Hemicordylus capensis]
MSKHRKKFITLINKATTDGEKLAPEEMTFSYDGIIYPTTLCSPETFKALESFEAREDDVFLAGYCKSGTNWVGQILNDLVLTSAKNTEDSDSLDDEELEEFPYIEVGDAEKYQRMKRLPSRRVIFTHLRPEKLPASIFSKKVKILLLLRNPKDVATSFYHFCNNWNAYPSFKTWDDYFTAFMNGQMLWGSYIDYIFEWNKHADDENIMAITYEELKENKVQVVKQISEFLELHPTDEEIQGVVDRSSFQAMKANADNTHGEFGNVLFRKGGVSDWKYLFSEEHNREMDAAFEERLSETKLGRKLKYGVYCKA